MMNQSSRTPSCNNHVGYGLLHKMYSTPQGFFAPECLYCFNNNRPSTLDLRERPGAIFSTPQVNTLPRGVLKGCYGTRSPYHRLIREGQHAHNPNQVEEETLKPFLSGEPSPEQQQSAHALCSSPGNAHENVEALSIGHPLFLQFGGLRRRNSQCGIV